VLLIAKRSRDQYISLNLCLPQDAHQHW